MQSIESMRFEHETSKRLKEMEAKVDIILLMLQEINKELKKEIKR